MKLTIELDREVDGRWIAKVPELKDRAHRQGLVHCPVYHSREHFKILVPHFQSLTALRPPDPRPRPSILKVGQAEVPPIGANLEHRGRKMLETRFPPYIPVAVIGGVTALKLAPMEVPPGSGLSIHPGS